MKSNPSKLKIALGIVVVCLILGIAIMALYSPVIFQRGNPIPYLRASAKLNDDTQYVQVKQTESESIYSTRKGESDGLLRMFAEGTGEALESYKDKISQGDIISVASDSAEVSDILRAYQENYSFRIYFPQIDDTADRISVTCLDVVQYDSNGEVIQQ